MKGYIFFSNSITFLYKFLKSYLYTSYTMQILLQKLEKRAEEEMPY